MLLKEETIEQEPQPCSISLAHSVPRQVSQNASDEESESEDEGSNSEDSEDTGGGAETRGKEEAESTEEELEPTTFVNISMTSEEAGPSGIQKQVKEKLETDDISTSKSIQTTSG